MDKVLTFFLDNCLCGIDISYVKEIDRKVEYTAVIGEDERLLGLLNLRGQVITLVDLAKMAGISQTSSSRKYCIILKENKGSDAVGFFVDKLGEVLVVEPDMWETSLVKEQQEKTSIEAVLKLADKIILVFDVYKLLECA